MNDRAVSNSVFIISKPCPTWVLRKRYLLYISLVSKVREKNRLSPIKLTLCRDPDPDSAFGKHIKQIRLGTPRRNLDFIWLYFFPSLSLFFPLCGVLEFKPSQMLVFLYNRYKRRESWYDRVPPWEGVRPISGGMQAAWLCI